jgi:PKD repeat protein
VQTVTLNFSLDATWDVADVEFVSFVQSQGVKEVYNGIKRGAIDLTPGFTASATSVSEDDEVTFTNETFGGYIGVPESWNWLFPGGTPATSTDKDPVIVYSTAGTYDVTLIVNRGSQIDTLVKPAYITVSGSQGVDPAAIAEFLIYPNPGDGNFMVRTGGSFDLKIVDLTGNVVYNRKGITGTSGFNTGLKPGVYFVMIQSGSRSHNEKLVIR